VIEAFANHVYNKSIADSFSKIMQIEKFNSEIDLDNVYA